MKKDYRKITLEKGITINEMVFYLMEYASRGEFVCVEYEGHKFYSDTISMNSAYQKVYGKSYYEIMADGQDASEDVETPVASVEETVAEVAETTVKVEEVAVETTEETAEETAEEVVAETTAEVEEGVAEVAEEAPVEEEEEELLSELEKYGRSRIRKPYWAAWKKCVELYEGDAEKEKDLDVCLDIISAIDENDLKLKAAVKVVKNLDLPKEKVDEILEMLQIFGDKAYYIAKKSRASKGFRKTTALGEANCAVYIDRDTRCQYLWVKDGGAGGMHLLVNPDGTPKLYEGDVE
ncbi:MAG: hypothetical protein IIV45_11925 [Lachnospiraceae bacterium]|nr:hypothetical protein [Lachnospiraceae bacterium]